MKYPLNGKDLTVQQNGIKHTFFSFPVSLGQVFKNFLYAMDPFGNFISL